MTTYTETMTAIGRCARCKTAMRVSFTWNGNLEILAAPARKFRIEHNDRSALVKCECGAAVRVRAIRGTVNTDKVCNARCMGAVGPACECECGGENHGGRFAL